MTEKEKPVKPIELLVKRVEKLEDDVYNLKSEVINLKYPSPKKWWQKLFRP